MKRWIFLLLLNVLFLVSFSQNKAIWSKEKASEWYNKQPWLVGANFFYPAQPSINWENVAG